MTNFLKETMKKLDDHKKDFYKDVLWIGTNCGSCSVAKEDFLVMADFDYDSGYGCEEILRSLVVVGEDWWLAREEYDGSEWWSYNEKPVLRPTPTKLVSLKEEY